MNIHEVRARSLHPLNRQEKNKNKRTKQLNGSRQRPVRFRFDRVEILSAQDDSRINH